MPCATADTFGEQTHLGCHNERPFTSPSACRHPHADALIE